MPRKSVIDLQPETFNALNERLLDILKMPEVLKQCTSKSGTTEEERKALRKAAEAYASRYFQTAATYYKKCTTTIGKKNNSNVNFINNNEHSQWDIVIQYMLCKCLLESKQFTDLTEARSILLNLEETVGRKYPMIYYALGQFYVKVFCFKEAERIINSGIAILNDGGTIIHCYVPETNDIIQESTKEDLSTCLLSLKDQCAGWHRPDATCSMSNCKQNSSNHLADRSIFFKSPAFNGMVTVTCNNVNPCTITFHSACWRVKKEELFPLKKMSDKDLLNFHCFTPNCVQNDEISTIKKIDIYSEDATIKTSIEAPPEKQTRQQTAPAAKGAIKKQKIKTTAPKIHRPKPTPSPKPVPITKPRKVSTSEEDELNTRLARLLKLRADNFNIEKDNDWRPDMPFYGTSFMVATNEELSAERGLSNHSEEIANLKSFLDSYFYQYISTNAPVKTDMLTKKWNEATSMIRNCDTILYDSHCTNVTEFLLESLKFVVIGEYICTSATMAETYALVKDNISTTLRCLMENNDDVQLEDEEDLLKSVIANAEEHVTSTIIDNFPINFMEDSTTDSSTVSKNDDANPFASLNLSQFLDTILETDSRKDFNENEVERVFKSEKELAESLCVEQKIKLEDNEPKEAFTCEPEQGFEDTKLTDVQDVQKNDLVQNEVKQDQESLKEFCESELFGKTMKNKEFRLPNGKENLSSSSPASVNNLNQLANGAKWLGEIRPMRNDVENEEKMKKLEKELETTRSALEATKTELAVLRIAMLRADLDSQYTMKNAFIDSNLEACRREYAIVTKLQFTLSKMIGTTLPLDENEWFAPIQQLEKARQILREDYEMSRAAINSKKNCQTIKEVKLNIFNIPVMPQRNIPELLQIAFEMCQKHFRQALDISKQSMAAPRMPAPVYVAQQYYIAPPRRYPPPHLGTNVYVPPPMVRHNHYMVNNNPHPSPTHSPLKNGMTHDLPTPPLMSRVFNEPPPMTTLPEAELHLKESTNLPQKKLEQPKEKEEMKKVEKQESTTGTTSSTSTTAETPQEGARNPTQSLDKLMTLLRWRNKGVLEYDLLWSIKTVRKKHNNSLAGLPMSQILLEAEQNLRNREKLQLASYIDSQTHLSRMNAEASSQRQRNPSVSSNSSHVSVKSLGIDSASKKNPWALVTDLSWTKEAEESECVICMEPISKSGLEPPYTLKCQHTFHNQCIRGWFTQNRSCPTCRVHSTLDDEFPPLP